MRKLARTSRSDEERGRHRARDDDLELAELVERFGSRATTIGPYPDPMLAPCGRSA
jgi:hypothetical protein